MRVWAPKTGQCKHVFEGHTGHSDSVTSICSSPDGDRILSGAMDGKVMLLQISGKRVLKEFLPPPPSKVEEDVKGGDEMEVTEDGEVAIPTVECVGFCQNSAFNWAASGGSSKLLKIWDLISGMCRTSCKHGGSVVALKWHSSIPYITTAALDNFVRVWDARSGACVLELTGHNDLVTNLDMRTIIIAEEASGDALPAAPGAPVSTSGRSVDVIVSVSDDHTARVFHFSGGELQSTVAAASSSSMAIGTASS